MPVIFLYIIKLSICLSAVYFFYQLILRRLTFYNWNRVYLAGYTLLSFLIPVIDITPVLKQAQMTNSDVIRMIPMVGNLHYQGAVAVVEKTPPPAWTAWDWLLAVIVAGMAILLFRLIIQLLSFKKIIKNAELLSVDDVKLYQVNTPITPFSFGNSIFINSQMHKDDELSDIIRHEFVHVKQKHTVDIIGSELLCILNWFNPFVWGIRKAVRQNLEFIADQNVVASGIDKKQYQYLLLKVTGNNHFSIASQFNFSSLKKRIAMMNKIKSARSHLIKFLFFVPVIAFLMLSFRSPVQMKNTSATARNLNQEDSRTLNPTISSSVSLIPGGSTDFTSKGDTVPSPRFKKIVIDDKIIATVTLNDGKTETYNLMDKREQEIFDEKYGSALPTSPRVAAMAAVSSTIGITAASPKIASSIPVGTTITAAPVPVADGTATTISAANSTSSAPAAIAGGTISSAMSAHPVKATRNAKATVLLEVKNDLPENRLRQMATDLKSKGYDLLIDKLDYRNGKIVLLIGSISASGRTKSFKVFDFIKFVISDVQTENDKMEFNMYVMNGNLVWE